MKKMIFLMVLFLLLSIKPAFATVQDVNVVPPPPPPAATSITVSGITDTSAQVSWPAVSSATQYSVYLNGQVYTGSNNPGAMLRGLSPHTSYSIYVIANNAGGDSPQSATVNFTTLSPVPAAPSVPTVQTNSTTANLTWQPLATEYNITQYKIYLDGQLSATIQPKTGMQSASLTNLSTGNHTIAISATNDNREGPQSQSVSFIISSVLMPIGLQYYNKSSNLVWLSWQPVPGASSYSISLNGQAVGQSYQSSYVLQGLSADTNYQISVATVMPDGEQSENTNLSIQTEPLAPLMSVNSLENRIFAYIPDTKIYIEILFAIVAALMIANNLKFVLKNKS